MESKGRELWGVRGGNGGVEKKARAVLAFALVAWDRCNNNGMISYWGLLREFGLVFAWHCIALHWLHGSWVSWFRLYMRDAAHFFPINVSIDILGVS